MNLLVGAFSFLVPGRVFVANMTGNVIFLGFAALVILVAVMIATHLAGRSNPAWASEP